MKHFLRTLTLIFSPPLIIFILIIYYGDWSSDNFYYKVSSSKQKSMILGGSRALQGLNPDILNENLNRSDIFNFAFTNFHSPYGFQYMNAIKNKMDNSKNNNIYFLCVNPWVISSKIKSKDDIEKFRELESNLFVEDYGNGLVGKLKYYYSQYNEPLFKLIFNFRRMSIASRSGYLKVKSKSDLNVINKKLQDYKKNVLPNYQFSTTRYNQLASTIKLLKDYGNVYLIRLPMHNGMYQIENKSLKGFDDLIFSLSEKFNIKYINLTLRNDEFNYHDGNHLEYESAKKVSELIALEIRSHIK